MAILPRFLQDNPGAEALLFAQADALAEESRRRKMEEDAWNQAMAEAAARIEKPRIFPMAEKEGPEAYAARQKLALFAPEAGWKPIEYMPEVVEAPSAMPVMDSASGQLLTPQAVTGNLVVKGNYPEFVQNQIAGGQMPAVSPFSNIDQPAQVLAEELGPLGWAPPAPAATSAAKPSAVPFVFQQTPSGDVFAMNRATGESAKVVEGATPTRREVEYGGQPFVETTDVRGNIKLTPIRVPKEIIGTEDEAQLTVLGKLAAEARVLGDQQAQLKAVEGIRAIRNKIKTSGQKVRRYNPQTRTFE